MRRFGLVSLVIAAGLLASCAGAGDQTTGSSDLTRKRCATKTFTNKEASALEDKLEKVVGAPAELSAVPGSIAVKVYAHVISTSAAGKLDKAAVKRQIDKLNQAYAGGEAPAESGGAAGANTAFRFTVADTDIDFTVNDAWAHMTPDTKEERAAKTALHRGGPADLNLYFA